MVTTTEKILVIALGTIDFALLASCVIALVVRIKEAIARRHENTIDRAAYQNFLITTKQKDSKAAKRAFQLKTSSKAYAKIMKVK